MFKTINEISNLRGTRVLLRLDLNVPIENGIVKDDYRMKQALPTIQFLRDAGAKIIAVSHLEGKGGDTLEPVYEHFLEILPKGAVISFMEKYPSKDLDNAIATMKE